jgi:hypothetical protein
MYQPQKSIETKTKAGIPKTSAPFFALAPVIQKKMSIGSSNDAYEVEADNIANKVMRMSEPSQQNISHTGALVQRKCSGCEQEEKLQMKPLADSITSLIQRRSTESGGESQAPSHVESQINSSKGGGNSMDHGTQRFMESRFGTDFSDVKIHTGSQAVQMSRELNAQAFTVGNDVYFNEGKYSPNSDSGRHLLAHELTHTVQQGGIGRKIQREPVTAVTISAVAIKCIIGAIIGVLFDLAIQLGSHYFSSSSTEFTIDYCSLIVSAVLSCIAAPIISYGIGAWLASRLAGSAYGSIVGTLLGRLLIWIVARAGMAVPKWIVGRLFRLGCISEEQHTVLQAS